MKRELKQLGLIPNKNKYNEMTLLGKYMLVFYSGILFGQISLII